MGDSLAAEPATETADEPVVSWAADGPYYTPVMASPGDKSIGAYAEQAVSRVRRFRHSLAKASLVIWEGPARLARALIDRLTSESKELHMKAEAVAASCPSEAANRPWCLACQDSHHTHRPEDDPPAPPERVPGFRGCLEVELLSVQEEPPLVREDGTKAVDPVCQFSLEGRNTGLLRAANSETSPGLKPISSTRFVFREVAGVDLRVNLFDHGSTRFKMGFEHQAFCGGVFVPLAAVIQRGAESGPAGSLGERLFCSTFEARLGLALLPLALLQTNSKLQPAHVTGASRPLREHGHILLRLRLTLCAPQLGLYFAGQSGAPANRDVTLAQVSDPLSVLKATAAVASRTGSVLDVEPWLAASDELSGDPLPAALFVLWWTCTTLWAPVCSWPLLCLAVLPLFSWKMHAAVRHAAKEKPVRMYKDEALPEPQPEVIVTHKPPSCLSKVVKEAVNAQLTVMQLVEMASRSIGHLERMVYVLSIHDSLPSALCGLVAAALACLLGGVLFLLQCLSEAGYLRYLLWLAGCDYFVPIRWRAPVAAFNECVMWAVEQASRGLLRLFAPIWQRLPDGPEAVHLALFKRYVFISSTGARGGASERSAAARRLS